MIWRLISLYQLTAELFLQQMDSETTPLRLQCLRSSNNRLATRCSSSSTTSLYHLATVLLVYTMHTKAHPCHLPTTSTVWCNLLEPLRENLTTTERLLQWSVFHPCNRSHSMRTTSTFLPSHKNNQFPWWMHSIKNRCKLSSQST